MKLHLLLNRKFNFQQFTPRPPQAQNMSCPNKDRAFLPDSNCSFWLRVLLSMSIHPLGWKTTPGNAPKFVLFPYKFIRKKDYSSDRAYMEIFFSVNDFVSFALNRSICWVSQGLLGETCETNIKERRGDNAPAIISSKLTFRFRGGGRGEQYRKVRGGGRLQQYSILIECESLCL